MMSLRIGSSYQDSQKSVVCKKCGRIGHNKRTRKGKTFADRNIPKGGNKVIFLQYVFSIAFNRACDFHHSYNICVQY